MDSVGCEVLDVDAPCPHAEDDESDGAVEDGESLERGRDDAVAVGEREQHRQRHKGSRQSEPRPHPPPDCTHRAHTREQGEQGERPRMSERD